MKTYLPLLASLLLISPLAAQEDKAAALAAQEDKAAAEEFSELPPAKPGECYIRTKLPAEYAVVKQKVLVKPATEDVTIAPAVFTQIVKKVMVSEAYTKIHVTDAQFEMRDVRVAVKPASTELVEIPPKFKEIEEEVIIKPAQQMWKKGAGLRSELAGSDASALMCLVTIPAETKKVKRLIEVQPARTEKREVPGEWEVVKKRVLIKPAKMTEEVVPAEYADRLVLIPVEGPKRTVVAVPAVFEEVDTKILVTPERMGWTRVLCDTNLDGPILMDIQDALKAKGYASEGKRGELDQPMIDTVKKYAKDNNLASGLTYDLLKHLNVKAPEARIVLDD